jgi:hypothetical protein
VDDINFKVTYHLRNELLMVMACEVKHANGPMRAVPVGGMVNTDALQTMLQHYACKYS